MTLREISALVSTILVIVGTFWYIRLALKGEKVKPVLASWVVIGGTMTLSFATYWTTPRHSLVSNACNAISVLSTGSILITAAWLTMQQRKGLSFSKFQKICLWISLAIAIFWIVLVWGFKGTGIVPNILTQILMLIGYLVTAEKLWHATSNSESLFTWWCILLAGVVALYTGIASHDRLVILYAARTTFGTVVLIWLMYRAEREAQLVN
jgi:lipid-A-disaccharide synthase-like uncharacterized protein